MVNSPAKSVKNESVYDASKQIVVSTYSGFIKTETFKEACLQAIENLKRNNTGKLLVDNRELQVMAQESQEWIQQVWFPKAIAAGLKRISFIMPESIFGKASMENANKDAKDAPIDIMYFDDYDKALDWLMN